MRSRVLLMAAAATAMAVACSTAAVGLEFREEPYRVGIIDVGEPVLLNHEELTTEMTVNTELRHWIESYGRPEYAEYQKVALNDPFLPYEIRLYYIEGRKYVAFGRVAVAPAVPDFGVRKYIGKLDSAMLQRLLTARPLEEAARMAAAQQVGYTPPTYGQPPVVVEVAEEEEVVEIVTPDTVVVAEEVAVEIEESDGTVVELEEEEVVVVDEVEAVEDDAPAAPEN